MNTIVPWTNFKGTAKTLFSVEAEAPLKGYIQLQLPNLHLLRVTTKVTHVEHVTAACAKESEKAFKRSLFRKSFKNGADKRNGFFRLSPYYSTKVGLLVNTLDKMSHYHLVPLEEATIFMEEVRESDSEYEPSTESEAEAEAEAEEEQPQLKTPTRPKGPKPTPAAPVKPSQSAASQTDAVKPKKLDFEGFTEEELDELDRELELHYAVQEAVEDWEFQQEVARRANAEIRRRILAAQEPQQSQQSQQSQQPQQPQESQDILIVQESQESSFCAEALLFSGLFFIGLVIYCAFLAWYLHAI